LDIAKYIKELIIKNECIILPGFGGFETRYKPACLDRQTETLIPPSKQIVFREDYKVDNGVLVNYINTKEKTGIAEVKRIVDDYIREIAYKIDIEERFDFIGIGTLIKDNNGKLLFKPLEDENYLIDSYGLSKLKLPKRKTSKELNKATEANESLNSKKSFKPFYYVAGLTLLVSIVLIFVNKYDFTGRTKSVAVKDESEETNKSEKYVFGSMRLSKPDTTDIKIEHDIKENTLKKNALLYKEIESNTNENIINNDERDAYYNKYREYHIIAGSFKKKDNALNQINNLKDKGFEPTLCKTENGFYRVVLNIFTDRSMALQELEKFRKGLGNSVWILSI
jgi:nucleoid DNA-binding protein